MIKLKQILQEGLGDCYQAGGRLIMNFFGDKEHKLVHGMVNGQGALEGIRFGHCWVESKDTVLDLSPLDRFEICLCGVFLPHSQLSSLEKIQYSCERLQEPLAN